MDWIKNIFKKKEEIPAVSQVENNNPKTKRKPKLSEKDQATLNKEPYVAVLETHFDPKDPGSGYFELDWNSFFIDSLRKAGYTGVTEEEIVDKWFKTLCQNVIAEDNLNREIRIV